MRTPVLTLILLCGACLSAAGAARPDDGLRFAAVDIYLQSTEPVAAWQFEFSSNGRIVGVENGESAAFAGAPYYDREAVQRGAADRIIVADYSLAEANRLPFGRIRIATLHLVLSGPDDPEFDIDLVTAVAHDGAAIDASIGLDPRGGNEQ